MVINPSISVIGSFVAGISVRLPRTPFPGETLIADLFDYGPGGKGNNVAVAANRLGADVTLIERLGDDIYADLAFDLYKEESIDVTHIHRTEGEQTGIGLVYLQQNGENTIGLYKGANELLSPNDIQLAEKEISKSSVLYVQLEVEDKTVSQAVSIAKQNGLTVILNPAPARELSREILKSVDILTPNAVEAFMLLDEPVPENPDNEQLINISNELLSLGPKSIVITMGSKGALLTQKNESTKLYESFHVDAIDTVGAGDSFNGGLAVAIAEGKSIDEAVKLANINGALATERVGVIDSLPTKKEIESVVEGK